MRSTKHEIWLIDEMEGRRWQYVDPTDRQWLPRDPVLRKDARTATAEELCELMDLDAENVNAHDFVGSHRLLGSLLFRMLGRKRAAAVLRRIAYRRGLHGMSGRCGLRHSYEDLAVGEGGRGWTGQFTKGKP